MTGLECVEEGRQDGHGRVLGHGRDVLVAPKAGSDEEDSAPDQGDVGEIGRFLKI